MDGRFLTLHGMTVVDDIRLELGTSTENPFSFNHDNPNTTSFYPILNTSASNKNLLTMAFILMVPAESLIDFAPGITIASLIT